MSTGQCSGLSWAHRPHLTELLVFVSDGFFNLLFFSPSICPFSGASDAFPHLPALVVAEHRAQASDLPSFPSMLTPLGI